MLAPARLSDAESSARPCCSAFISAHCGWSRSMTIGHSPLPGGASFSSSSSGSSPSADPGGSSTRSRKTISVAWRRARNSHAAYSRYPSPGRGCAANTSAKNLPGSHDLLIPLPQPPGEVAAGHLGVPVHAHASFAAGMWPLPSTVTLVMIWPTLRRTGRTGRPWPAGSTADRPRPTPCTRRGPPPVARKRPPRTARPGVSPPIWIGSVPLDGH